MCITKWLCRNMQGRDNSPEHGIYANDGLLNERRIETTFREDTNEE